MPLKAKLAFAFLLLSVLGLVLGALLLPWWTGETASGSFAIYSRYMEMCSNEVCAQKSLAAAGASATPWAKMGTAMMATSLVAVGLLGICAVSIARRRALGMVAWVAAAFAFFAGVLGLAFAWAHPEFGAWTPAWGMACTLAGSVVGAVAAGVGVASMNDSLRQN